MNDRDRDLLTRAARALERIADAQEALAKSDRRRVELLERDTEERREYVATDPVRRGWEKMLAQGAFDMPKEEATRD